MYDPCCGGAYLLTTLGYLHGSTIGAIVGSDIDPVALSLAERNLGLLSLDGLDDRIAELGRMQSAYGKNSHTNALTSAYRLRQRLFASPELYPVDTHLFLADATDGEALALGLRGRQIDVVLTDVPYGIKSSWKTAQVGSGESRGAVWAMLEALQRAPLAPSAVVAVAADKGQRVSHDAYCRRERFRVGMRQITLLTKK